MADQEKLHEGENSGGIVISPDQLGEQKNKTTEPKTSNKRNNYNVTAFKRHKTTKSASRSPAGRPNKTKKAQLASVQNQANRNLVDAADRQEIIMTQHQFQLVEKQYKETQLQQDKLIYKIRKFLSENFLGKYLCCCLKVKDKTKVPWSEMSEDQRKHRIKLLWKKAKKILLYQKIRLSQDRIKNTHVEEDEDILENINLSSAPRWNWKIIRQENTLPQIWSFLVNTLTFYALFSTPFVLVFSDAGEAIKGFEFFVDIIFTIDIIANFFKLSATEKLSDLNEKRVKYLKNAFIFDCLACLPGLLTKEDDSIKWFKLARFIHYSRFFEQINLVSEKILMKFGYTKQKIGEYVDFLKLQMSVVLLTHIFSCLWIAIGKWEEGGWVNEFLRNVNAETGRAEDEAYVYFYQIYTNAFYFTLTTITTVGYGDISGSTTSEFIFSMVVEFVGLSFFSMMNGTVGEMFSGTQSFESLINERMEQLDLWLLRLENCNKEEKIPNKLYHSIKEHIQDAFVNDYNMITEEFDFYGQLPSNLQNKIAESLFRGFKNQFRDFFMNTDIGFMNKLIISMYCRIYEPGKILVHYGQKIEEMYFITRGSIVLYDCLGVTPFIQLPQYSFFGDYQLIFDLNCNFVAKCGGKEDFSKLFGQDDKTFLMCIGKDDFMEQFNTYPKSRAVVQKRALQRRMVFMQHLEALNDFLAVRNEKMKEFAMKKIQTREQEAIIEQIFQSQQKHLHQLKKVHTLKKKNMRQRSQDSERASTSNNTYKKKEKNVSDLESAGHSLITDLKVTETSNSVINIREENSKKMTDFRYDELNFPENSDDEVDQTKFSPEMQQTQDLPELPDMDDIEELTNEVEDKMKRVSNTIRGIDKRMSLNLRLISGIVMNQDNFGNQAVAGGNFTSHQDQSV